MTTAPIMAGERINYLSIALRARAAIKTLKCLVETREFTSELKRDLEVVLNSLKSGDSKPLRSKLSNEVPYSRFEEVQTLDEVAKSFKDTDLVSRLEALLKGACEEDDVRSAIRVFSAIEKRALYQYNDPSWAEAGM